MGPRLTDIATSLTLAAAATAAVSYTFSASYIFAIEPAFIQAFSLSDLIFLFVSSLSTLATLVVICVPIFIMIPLFSSAIELRRKHLAMAVDLPEEGTMREAAFTEEKSPYKTAEFLGVAFLLVCILVGQAVATVFSLTMPDEITVSPAAGGAAASGLCMMIGIIVRPKLFIALAVPMALFIVLSSAFMAGDVLARRDVSADRAGLPCAFTNGGKSCLDVLVLGSEAAILRRDDKVFLFPRDELKVVASRRVHSRQAR